MYLKKNDFFGAANVKSQKGMILAGELQFYQLPVGISLLTPCCKNTPHAGAIYNNFKVYHIICSEEERRAGHELRANVTFKKTTYVQGQIYKHFVKSNGNIVLIILETFFEVRPVNHLKQFIVENEGSFFFTMKCFGLTDWK